jgi:hypothetical protein
LGINDITTFADWSWSWQHTSSSGFASIWVARSVLIVRGCVLWLTLRSIVCAQYLKDIQKEMANYPRGIWPIKFGGLCRSCAACLSALNQNDTQN